MDEKGTKSHYNIKGLIKYISTVISGTIFVILVVVGAFLLYYYISNKLYATKGEKYEPFFSIYTIVSPSMEPTINTYDVIINIRVDDPEDVQINDVITFISTSETTYGMTITHRVVGTSTLDDGSVCYITRGDNNTIEDDSCVSQANVIGKVKAVISSLGKIQVYMANSAVWLIAIIIMAAYMIIKDIIKILKLNEKVSENSVLSNKIEPKQKKKNKNKNLENAYQDLKKSANKK